uniref:Uncharacterized protein n=1 Tax=Populus alba TaxID=43335 RepID=A0A4U5R2R0_POPAL|nr:hypothetical protein D5086_0000030010 [Populus alba]
MKRGSCSVAEYSRAFNSHCDQLSAMRCLVEDSNEVHWYLCGLGHEFSTFSIAQLSLTLIPSFNDVVPKAGSFDLFFKTIKTMQVSLLMLLMSPLSTEMQSLIIINRNIREANSKEEIIANNSIIVPLVVKYVMKKGTMPRTANTDTLNMMRMLWKHLQIAQLAMTLLTDILIQEH